MQQQRVVRALHLQEMASCFDAEAATWRLLWHLYGVGARTYPGGLGGPKLPGCPGASTVAQHIAETLEQDAELNRWTSCLTSAVPCMRTCFNLMRVTCHQHCCILCCHKQCCVAS